MAQAFHKVIVVGAGPVGLLLAYMLAKRNIEVVVLEADKELNKQPRGIAYGPPAVAVLKRAGLLDGIHERGTTLKTLSWRKLSGEAVATLEMHGDEEEVVVLPVPDLTQFLLEHLEQHPRVSVCFDHQVSNVGTTGHQGWVEIQTGDSDGKKMFGDYVLGCDGGRSQVRKALFGNEFPGFTWEKQVVAIDLIYDIESHGWSDANWIVDPDHWGVIAKISSKAHRWRVAYGEEIGLASEELMKRLPQKLQTILPGHPTPDDYELLRFSPFIMNQRCAPKMKVGRVLLAGDAAHLCNPMGGLGLTSGIADAGSLIDCFYGLLDGKAEIEILDKYDEIRREIYRTHTSPISTANLERVMKEVEGVASTDPFICNIAAHNQQFLRTLHDEGLKMSCDMTKFYTN